MVEIKPFKGTRPYNEDAKNLIAPSTDHLSIENIEIFKKNNYWNYLKILNPVGQLKEADTLLEAKSHFNEMKENDVIKKDKDSDENEIGFLMETKGMRIALKSVKNESYLSVKEQKISSSKKAKPSDGLVVNGRLSSEIHFAGKRPTSTAILSHGSGGVWKHQLNWADS